MVWGKKLEKQDLIDAGLDPDKLVEFQSKGVTKDMLDTMKSDILASVSTTINDTITNNFKELENKLKPTPTGGNNNNGGNNNTGGGNTTPTPEEEMADYLANPTDYIKRQVGGVGIGAALEFKKMSRELAYESLSSKLVGFKNAALKAEIDEEWKKYTPEVFVRQNGDPATVLRQVHDMVIGRHHEEIRMDADKKDGKYNIVSSSGGGNSGGGNFNNGNNNNSDLPKITPDEHAQAVKFGMTDEEWIKQGSEMEEEEKNRRKVQVTA